MANTLSKIFVGSIGGSFGLLARGASQKKCASSAHIAPAADLARATIACTAGESGLGSGAWASGTAAAMHVSAIAVSGSFLTSRLLVVAARLPFRIVGLQQVAGIRRGDMMPHAARILQALVLDDAGARLRDPIQGGPQR